VERHVGKGGGEEFPGAREQEVPEGPAAADLVLPQTRLRFVYPQRGERTRRGAEILRVEPLFVEPMPRFVQDAEERLVEVMRVVAGRDAAVAGADAAAERVRGRVETAGLEVEADDRGGLVAELILLWDRVLAFEDLGPRALPRRHDLRHEGRQLRL